MRTFLKVRRWRWIGRELKKNWTSITGTVVRWTPDGKWKRETPVTTWRMTVEEELKQHQPAGAQ